MNRILVLTMSLIFLLVGIVGCNTTEVATKSEAIQEKESQLEIKEEIKENNQNENTDKDEEKYKRTIGGTVAVVEMLDLLNIKICGVPNSSHELPESCKEAEKIGKPMTPDIEIIKSLNPDMFVSVTSLQADLEKKLNNSKINSMFIDNSSYSSILTSIENLGQEYGKEDIANKFINDVTEKVNMIKDNIEQLDKPKVMLLFGSPKSIMLATKNSFVGSMINEIGAINVADEIGDFKDNYVPLSMEDALKSQPDIILRMTHAKPEDSKAMFDKEFAENSIWQKFDAVKNDKVFDLDNEYFGVSGNIRIIRAMELLEEILFSIN